jgi:hypothetical protein
MKDKKLPPYVWFTNGKSRTAMRLIDQRRYWRDGGAWGTEFKIESDGSITTCGHTGKLSHLNGKKLVPCTKAEWKKDNGQYAS